MSVIAKAIFFDVDGVLLDSLPQHLEICRYEAKKFSLAIKVPSADEFRKQVAAGVKVSPMLYFFLAVGFPKKYAELAVEDYQNYFMRLFPPRPFPGIETMLSELKNSGLKLGLITSNTRANVEPALGKALRLFELNCLFYFDSYPEPKSKHWYLVEGARLLKVNTTECIYIGDQPGDASAAQDANVQFLGVTYGWGIMKHDRRFRTVSSVDEIANELLSQQPYPQF